MNPGAHGLPTPQPSAFTPVCKVGDLPTGGIRIGQKFFATDCRVFDGAGTRESGGAGTGGEVQWNGTAWKIVGTNVTAAA